MVALLACPRGEAEPTAAAAAPAPASVVAEMAPAAPADPPADADRKLTFADIEPILRKDCDHCHGANPTRTKIAPKAKKHLETASYPFHGHHGAAVLDEILESLQVDEKGRRKMPMDHRRDYPDERAERIVKWIIDGALDAKWQPPVWPKATGHAGHDHQGAAGK